MPPLLPILPETSRKRRPHNRPMSSRIRLLPFASLVRPVPVQDAALFVLAYGEQVPGRDLMLRSQEALSRRAVQVIPRYRVAEGEFIDLAAEDDQVGEIRARLGNGPLVWRVLPEQAASRKVFHNRPDNRL